MSPVADPEKRELARAALIQVKVCRKCYARNPVSAVRCRKCGSDRLRMKKSKKT